MAPGGARARLRRFDAESWAFAALLLYFGARGVYLALSLAPGMPPDEIVHAGLCALYARSAWLPTDSAETVRLGLVSQQPYLYYLLMGKLLRMDFTPLGDLVFLRLVNVALGCATVVVAWRWIRLFSAERVVRIFFLVLLTNTLMWTALFASVSYDNLVNLLAATALYALTRQLRTGEPGALLGLGVAILAGTLTKTAFLPLAAILVAGLVANQGRRLARLPGLLRRATLPRLAAAGALLVLLACNLALYGENLLRFGHLVPAPTQLLSETELMRNPNLARDHIVGRYRQGELGFEEAVSQARSIPEPSLQRDTIYLLSVEQQRRSGALGSQPLSRLDYAPAWGLMMSKRIFGFMGHDSVFHPAGALAVYWSLALLAAAVFVGRAFAGALPSCLEWTMLSIAALYALVLMQLVNYPVYRSSNVLILAVQGRYLFPVMLPLYGLLARFAVGWGPAPLRWTLAAVFGAWFVAAELPFFLWQAGPHFFGDPGV